LGEKKASFQLQKTEEKKRISGEGGGGTKKTKTQKKGGAKVHLKQKVILTIEHKEHQELHGNNRLTRKGEEKLLS